MTKVESSESIQSVYDKQYSERMTEWRELGGKYKFLNIKNVIKNASFDKVIEFGAGEGSILALLDKSPLFKELYALEISDSGIEEIKKRDLSKLTEVKKFDGYKTDYKDKEFDLLYCSHVIEHVEHPRLVLREIKRISKNQVFEVPLDYSRNVDNKIKHFLDYGHINIFTPSLFKFLLKSEGFQIETELHTGIAKELHEYALYENLKLKKTLKRRIHGFLFVHKPRITKLIFGKSRSNEFHNSAYTCFTKGDGELKIF